MSRQGGTNPHPYATSASAGLEEMDLRISVGKETFSETPRQFSFGSTQNLKARVSHALD